jgi:hypothetical protein
MLKKNSIHLERDAINENIFYISFNYFSLSNFNIKIFFNACENNSQNSIKEESKKNTSQNSNNNNNNNYQNNENDLIDININEIEIRKNFK